MAVCPKCGRKLKITDLKPECPNCKVNLLYYKIEERLEVDAINAELEHAKTQQKVDRVKAAFVGSPLTIVRIVLLVLSVGMFFLPLATMHVTGPYFDHNTTINAIEVYNQLSAMDMGGLMTLIKSPVMGTALTYFAVAAVMIAVSAVCALLGLILSFLSCSPKGFLRNVILSVLGMATAITSVVMYSLFINNIVLVFPDLISGGISFGAYCVIAAFVLVLGINIAVKVKGVKVKYKETYVDSVPYSVFIDKFPVKRYDLDSLAEIHDEMEKYKVREDETA